MATERLYYGDAYLRAFDARVEAVRPDGWIALDRSAFYPTSGGQPFDTGTIRWEAGAARVLDVEAEGDAVWHKADAPVPAGVSVQGEIDWPRRWDHMQQHAADHMLAGAAWQMWGAVTIGLHIGRQDSSIDMELPGGRTRLTPEETLALETLVNRRVQQDDPIRCWFPGPEELSALPIRKRPTVAEHVRVVAMGDYEMVPCGGTHPAATGQIGPVKILSAAPARGMMRLRFLAGMRAVRYFQETARSAEETAKLLSAPVPDAPEALEREREEQRAWRRQAEEKLLQAALAVLAGEKRGRVTAGRVAFADPGLLVRAAAEITRDRDAAALLACPGKNGEALVFARGSGAEWDMAALMKRCGARGGGKPDMAQGSAPDGAALREAARILQENAE